MVAASDLAFRELLDELDPRCRKRLAIEFQSAARRAQKRTVRSRVEFALTEIYAPEGPHKGELLLEEFQPIAIEMLRKMDATPLRRFAITGCVQSGKTLIALVVNLCWHLFERGHTVIYGVPEMKMAKKKWEKEILPVIQANPRFRRLLPDHGSGSKGGFDGTIEFKNGATLEFMGATGNDSRRSSSTAQVLFKTEVDRFDTASDGSREASPAETMEDRVAAFEDSAYIYEECTRTTTRGRINVSVNNGTNHTPHAPCPHCHQFVSPTREHLVGYEDCESAAEARVSGTFICPNCAAILSQDDRDWMLDRLVTAPSTQSVTMGSDGEALLEGPLPSTNTFSFWWNAFFNRFWSTAYLAEKEWETITGRGADDDDDEKQWKQKRWSIAVEPTDVELEPLTIQDIYERHRGLRRGFAPRDAIAVTAGCDVRKNQLHYVIIAWRANGSGHVVDYGVWDINWKELGIEEAIPQAMVELALAKYLPGIPCEAEPGQPHRVLPVGYKLFDVRWQSDAVREGLRRLKARNITRARGVLGFGQSEPPGSGSYSHPKATSDKRPWIGRQCYLVHREDTGALEVNANSDEWKSFVRRAIGPEMPEGVPGAITIWEPQSADEKKLAREFGRQIRAEVAVRKFVPRRGEVDVWEHRTNAANHWGDGFYYACVGGDLEGIRIARQPNPNVPLQHQIATQPAVGAVAST